MEGTIKWYNRQKGYGFIIGDDGQEYFVHSTALGGIELHDDDRVSFDPAQNERGNQAQNVKLLEKGSEAKEEQSEEDKTD